MAAEAIIGAITLVGSLVTWLWRNHERTTTLGLKQAATDTTVEKLEEHTDARFLRVEAEQRNLRDGHVRTETTLEMMQARLASLDQLPAIAVSVRSIEATVTELKQQVIPREALEARLEAMERRLP